MRAPSRSAASACPGALPQSSAAAYGTPGAIVAAWATIARNHAAPMASAAAGGDSNSAPRGAANRRAIAAVAASWTMIAGSQWSLTVDRPRIACKADRAFVGDSMADTLMAAARLEAAVEGLAAALERRRATTDGVPRAEVAALAVRLDAALAKLRVALREPDDAEPAEPEA